ncbi:surfeit locus protein 6-domain-containing protein [Thelonectria olida]|uniref:Surfeit locus protein 6-domain-containing protein n=1 Tax=Thelonectria olida TaxID=1576542 RepID=A0A9P8W5L8_9HYPO|nr:surfeit locus protein 6-domain-containing protein [Thelonectria olida]
MGDSTLKDRLRDHSKAFDGLLALIPAKMYYPEDTSEQWQKTKQTKEEAAAARRGKLDPDSNLNRNAKEVMDERAKNKRKLRELEEAEEESADDENDSVDYDLDNGVEMEKPGEGLKVKVEANKKQKLSKTDTDPSPILEATPSKLSKKEAKKAAKREKKKERKERTEKTEVKAEKEDEDDAPAPAPKSQKQAAKKEAKKEAAKQAKSPKAPASKPTEVDEEWEDEEEDVAPSNDVQPMDLSGLEKEEDTSNPDSEPQSPTFDTSEPSRPANDTVLGEVASATTSVSSTIPPSEKPKHIKIPADTDALRLRLAAKIEALRAARKADTPDGKPIRTRQELIESRRKKQAQRKAHKQELRKKVREEEHLKREEALAAGSPGVMSPAVESDDKIANFTFGRMAFTDGSKLSHDLSYVVGQGKKKGPSDVKTALIKVQNQKKRLEELDPEKRADIEEKDVWLTARRRAEGERIRDDEALLKRAVKRKEVAKKKSEKSWKDRSDGVKMAQKERQHKREENLQKRRDDKLLHKAGKKKKKTKAPAGKKKSRPGFEGSLGMGGRKK